MTLHINARLTQGTSHLIEINIDDSINDVKREICNKTGLKLAEFDLIFGGKVLCHDSHVKDLTIGQGSVLHVYTGGKSSIASVDVKQHKQPYTRDAPKYQYFVYCRTCDDLQPGKLRVQCYDCGEGAIILNKEPDNWDDVLQRERLDGQCTTCDNKRFAQFYFKCAGHDGLESAIPLRHIRPNSRHRECIICTSESSPILVYPCRDKHVICVDCFKQYAAVSLDSRSFEQDLNIGYSLSCPAGCEESLIRDIHHFHLLGKEQYERYKDFAAEECLLSTGGIICPKPGCGEGLVVDRDVRSITCSSCYFEFCRRCRLEVHSGQCESLSAVSSQLPGVDRGRAVRSQWDYQSIDTIQHTTKPCPHCGTRTERNGGCMHITCTRCKKDWCWMCEKEWDRVCMGDHWFG